MQIGTTRAHVGVLVRSDCTLRGSTLDHAASRLGVGRKLLNQRAAEFYLAVFDPLDDNNPH